MKTVLILNHGHVECGTYQFAHRIYDIVSGSHNVNYMYFNVDSREEYLYLVGRWEPDYIVYNWHKDRINWLIESDIIEDRKHYRKHYFFFHDGSIFNKYDKYIFCGEFPNYPTSIPREKSVLLPRPIYNYDGIYPVNEVPTIGSFGFATDHKRFPDLVTLVNKSFDKAHIRLHITSPYFGVTEGYNLPKIVAECHANNTNPNVRLTITSNFVDDSALLKFLAGNDINVFNYAYMDNPGISSATDYALSVRRPFAVTKNNLFRHVANKDTLLEVNSMQEIINRGIAPYEEFYRMWNPENFRNQFDGLFI